MIKFGRRKFIKTALIAGSQIVFRSQVKAQEGRDQEGIARFFTKEKNKIHLLAVTDLHFFDSKSPKENNEKTVQALKALIEKFHPELMLINGDMWFEGFGPDGFRRAQYACSQISQLGIPWIFNFGNHDLMPDFKKTYELLSKAPNSLFRGSAHWGNYRVELCNTGEGIPFWILLIINDYQPERGFNQYQIRWFKEEIERIKRSYPLPPPAFIFIHIPLPQFNDLWKSGKAKGVKNEPVMHEGGTKKAFSVIKESGIVKAVFAGHDHLNNYWGEWEGIRLQYLRATGYGGYGGEKVKKGATIITIDLKQTPQYDAVTVFEDGSIWDYESK